MSRPELSPPASRERVAMTAGLVVVTLAGFATFILGLAGSVLFFGQGAEEAFRHWTDQALIWGGGVAAITGTAGIVVTWLAGRPGVRRPGVAAAGLAAIVAVTTGIVVHQQRSAPQGQERSALQRLPVSPDPAADRVTVGSLPVGDATVAGPSGQGPPAGVRSWQPGGCTSLDHAILAWADRGSVFVPRSFTVGPDGPACLWFATYHGWSVRAEVLGAPSAGPGTARVMIAPPGVGL